MVAFLIFHRNLQAFYYFSKSMENQVSLRIDRVRRLYDSRKARKMIEEAVADRVSDIYLVPRGQGYQVYHRIMDEREFVQDLAEEEVTAIISHFKF